MLTGRAFPAQPRRKIQTFTARAASNNYRHKSCGEGLGCRSWYSECLWAVFSADFLISLSVHRLPAAARTVVVSSISSMAWTRALRTIPFDSTAPRTHNQTVGNCFRVPGCRKASAMCPSQHGIVACQRHTWEFTSDTLASFYLLEAGTSRATAPGYSWSVC